MVKDERSCSVEVETASRTNEQFIRNKALIQWNGSTPKMMRKRGRSVGPN